MKINFESVLIGVTGIEKAKPFYETVFGVKFTEVRPPFSCFTMNDIEFNVEEDSPERDIGWAGQHIGTLKPISFNVDSVDEFLKLVMEHGGSVVEKPTDKSWGWREAKFSDSDGNTFLVEQEL